MPRKRYSTEQIVTKLRQAEVEFGRGPEAWRGAPIGQTRSRPGQATPRLTLSVGLSSRGG